MEKLTVKEKDIKSVPLNHVHLDYPKCKQPIDIELSKRCVIIGSYSGSFEEAVRLFLRSVDLSKSFLSFCEENGYDFNNSFELPSTHDINEFD